MVAALILAAAVGIMPPPPPTLPAASLMDATTTPAAERTNGEGTASPAIARWAGVGATLLAVMVALFKEELQRLWRRPVLKAVVRLAPPDCHKTTRVEHDPRNGTIKNRWDAYYLRVWIENRGRERATDVQVFAERLFQKQDDGTFVGVASFLPMNLTWSHTDLPFLPNLGSRGMGRHCDLGYLAELHSPDPAYYPLAADQRTTTRFVLCLEVEPNTRSHILQPGTYRLTLKIAASNADPVSTTIELDVSGTWYDTEAEMFTKGLTMQRVP